MSFQSLGLDPRILNALTTSGYTEPTPIQLAAIPLVLAGHDLMASAQTGSGKTAAFMLPALHKLATPSPVNGRGPRILVLTPTRELALQITNAATKYGSGLPRVKTASILGGMPYPLQNKVLSSTLDILIATPGRLLDHIGRGRIDFSRLEMLVIDEADRMLDMGFIDDVEQIGRSLPPTRQTLLFSATFEGPITKLGESILKTPQRVAIDGVKTRHENIEQRLLYTDDMGHKNRLLDHLLRDITVNQALVFTSTKANADDLADRLVIEGFECAALHGDMNQRERTRTLTGMRAGHIRVLVATDVAARGLDVQGITHVINYDLPRQAEDYIHRIGRTGRAGRSGIAISFAGGRDAGQVKQIERYTSQIIPVHTVEGLEPRYARGSSGSGGGKPSGGEGRRNSPRTSQPARSFERKREGAPSAERRFGDGARTRDAARSAPRTGHSNGYGSGHANGNTNGNSSFGNSNDGPNGNVAAKDGRSPFERTQPPRGDRRQRWGEQQPSFARAARPAATTVDDRQGDHFRASMRVQEERNAQPPKPFARKPGTRHGLQASQSNADPRVGRYREVEEYRTGGSAAPRKMPTVTVVHKKIREE